MILQEQLAFMEAAGLVPVMQQQSREHRAFIADQIADEQLRASFLKANSVFAMVGAV